MPRIISADDALAVRRALENVVAVPVQRDRLDEFGVVQAGGEIFLGVQPAAFAQRRHHVGGDGALVERLGAMPGNGAQRLGQRRMPEDVAGVRRVAARQEACRAILAQLRLQSLPVPRDLLVHRPAVGSEARSPAAATPPGPCAHAPSAAFPRHRSRQAR